ncbi:heptaprenyl diphosphate synthase subunit II [Thermogymnomonas acidicola]|uniref:Heptaprenyl diphosphate synthase subunit II n=1 Tax=Thermogymnomonas acidicola TaxID=399579 RepID=A0AA37BPU7_9ARCH|nr:polyprenyl synthetase family protein [Thermogymnomonas acidicola]GGM66237.1 heptaprenyl diphosphate synthase subunit II [Thermogymnomonas acidicola]
MNGLGDFLEWQKNLSTKIEKINARLLETVYCEQEELYSWARYTIEAGGKRFRPLLTILAYEIGCDRPYESILDLAAGYELIHTASLIHDDIIDNASFRRGLPTLNVKIGVNNAIVVADYLFAKAYELGSRYGPVVSKVMADASTKLAEGQILEAINLGNLSLPEETYLKIIENKTARFFAACALGATIAAGAPENVRKNLTDFAYNLGMAFQITDDILDIVGDQKKIGKPVLTDIRHSAITLPIIVALRNASSAKRKVLTDALRGAQDMIEPDLLRSVFIETNAIDYSFDMARKYTEKAMESLRGTGKSPDLNLLMELAMIVIERIEAMS